jgi:hypothetical protein
MQTLLCLVLDLFHALALFVTETVSVVSSVYVTVSVTFEVPISGYSTIRITSTSVSSSAEICTTSLLF